MSSNSRVGDKCMNVVLDSLMEGGTRLETLNLAESNLGGYPDEDSGISRGGVASIASFATKSKCELSFL
jgi:hypothetical protein